MNSTSSPIQPSNLPVTVLSYPTEVFVRTPTVIEGRLDASQVVNISVMAEDRFPLGVQLDLASGAWRVSLDSGFQNVGTRWLRVKGLNAANQPLSDQVLSISVRQPNARLTIKQDTVFKKSPADSSTLAATEKVSVKAGQTFWVERYGVVDGHVKVTLVNGIPSAGNFGYFFAPHVDINVPITLSVEQDTLFKASTAASSALADNQKASVKAGWFALLSDCKLESNHINVTFLETSIEPLGKTGFFFAPHIKLTKLGEEIELQPNQPLLDIQATDTTLRITADTLFKSAPADSAALNAQQKVALKAGANYQVVGYAAISGHFRVKLTSAIAPVGNTGYIFWKHAQLIKKGIVIPFDPDMKSLTIKQNTVFKRNPVDNSKLGVNDKANLQAGRIYGVESLGNAPAHFKVTLNEDIPPVGNTGFVFAAHVELKQGNKKLDISPDRKVLAVPYFSQRDNPRDPFVTCNVTAIAMVLYYHGVRSKRGGQLEDELYQWIIDRYGARERGNHAVLQQLYESYGFSGGMSYNRTWAQIKNEINENRPVVIGGYFTHGGHIVCIIGYDQKGFIVNDPYGDALTGYAQTEGRSLSYSYKYMIDMCGVDGDVWAHFIVPRK